MRRACLLASLLLVACSDDTGATTEPASTSTTSTTSTGAPDSSSTAPPTTTVESTTLETSEPTSTGTIDPTTSGSTGTSTGEPLDPVCDQFIKPCEQCSCTDAGWSCECPPLLPEAGFIEIEPVKFTIGQGNKAQGRTSSPARLFYSFRPAEPGVEGPLFVLFNGGPGSSTGTLMAFGTGPVALTPDLIKNPGSWATLGDLLYIDARGTGFSYNLAENPADLEVRKAEFGISNYNSYLDAADFVRVLLRFIVAHPQLSTREFVIVGESYGGMRATIMLELLLGFPNYDEGGPGLYDDAALVDEIETFLATRDPDVDEWTPAEISKIFPRQILIQPSLGGLQRTIAGQLLDLPDSPIFKIAQELGATFKPCSEQGADCLPWQNAVQFIENTVARSRYDLDAPNTWLTDLFAAKKAGLSDLLKLEAVLGLPPASVPLLPAEARGGAFRMIGLGSYPADGGTISMLGALEKWDRYYIPFLAESNNAIRSALADHVGIGPDDPHFAALFLHNLAHVDTFITAAERDIAIYAPSIPPLLATYTDIVDSVESLPGEFHVFYKDSPFPDEPAPGTRVVRFPTYDASHAVSLDQPTALRDDVAAWLAP
ncbi:MAG TPA: hypothetical protein VGB85_17225 [Nannocystis sp.]|jgi:pimeloyl-ACP methyl ester carboxylesterase